MTDGPMLQAPANTFSPSIDLTNFALWIELQPTTTIAGILDLIGNDLYRRNMFAYGNDIKQIVSELRT